MLRFHDQHIAAEPGGRTQRTIVRRWHDAVSVCDQIGFDVQRGFRRGGATNPPPNFRAVSDALVSQLEAQDNGDMAPTAAALAAYAHTCGELRTVVTRWQAVLGRELVTFNAARKKQGLAEVGIPRPALVAPVCR